MRPATLFQNPPANHVRTQAFRALGSRRLPLVPSEPLAQSWAQQPHTCGPALCARSGREDAPRSLPCPSHAFPKIPPSLSCSNPAPRLEGESRAPRSCFPSRGRAQPSAPSPPGAPSRTAQRDARSYGASTQTFPARGGPRGPGPSLQGHRRRVPAVLSPPSPAESLTCPAAAAAPRPARSPAARRAAPGRLAWLCRMESRLEQQQHQQQQQQQPPKSFKAAAQPSCPAPSPARPHPHPRPAPPAAGSARRCRVPGAPLGNIAVFRC